MKKDLAYYMSLPYEMKIEELSEFDGGGIMISIPLLGEAAVRGHGYTYEEARENFLAMKEVFLDRWVKDGVDIPEPPTEEERRAKIIEMLDKILYEEPIPA